MKTRTDFVSNSSSSSFIILDDATKGQFETCFPGRKMFSVKEYIDKFNSMLKQVDENIESLRNSLGNEYDEGRIFCDIYYHMQELKMSINDYAKSLKEIVDEHYDVCITEPVDRDEAYERNFNAPLYVGDL